MDEVNTTVDCCELISSVNDERTKTKNPNQNQSLKKKNKHEEKIEVTEFFWSENNLILAPFLGSSTNNSEC